MSNFIYRNPEPWKVISVSVVHLGKGLQDPFIITASIT